MTSLSARLPRVYHAASVPRETRTLVDDGSSGSRAAQEVDATVSELGGLGDEQRDELVEEVAREIQLRGLTASAVHFLQASRPYRPLGSNAMLFFDPVLHGLFGGDLPERVGAARRRGRHRAADRAARGPLRGDRLGRVAVAPPRMRRCARSLTHRSALARARRRLRLHGAADGSR